MKSMLLNKHPIVNGWDSNQNSITYNKYSEVLYRWRQAGQSQLDPKFQTQI